MKQPARVYRSQLADPSRGRGAARWLWLLLACIGSLAASLPSHADEQAADLLQPRVTRAQFAALIQPLQLNREQLMIVDYLHQDYDSEIARIIRVSDAAAVDAGRNTIASALSGRVRLTSDELRELRAAVLKAYRIFWPDADRAMENLLTGIDALLQDHQRETFEQELVTLRRLVWLQPVRQAELTYDYAGDGVDVLRLLERAMQPDGPLARFDVSAMDADMDAYIERLDAFLQRSATAMRDSRMDVRIARALRDDRAINEANARAMGYWKQYYDLISTMAVTIAQHAEKQLDRESAEAWMEHFYQTCFSWLYQERRCDRQYRWLARQTLTQPHRQAIEQAYASYQASFRELALEAIDLMVRARVEHTTPLHSMMDPTQLRTNMTRELYDALLKNSGQMTTLSDTTCDVFESLLDEPTRQRLRRSVR